MDLTLLATLSEVPIRLLLCWASLFILSTCDSSFCACPESLPSFISFIWNWWWSEPNFSSPHSRIRTYFRNCSYFWRFDWSHQWGKTATTKPPSAFWVRYVWYCQGQSTAPWSSISARSCSQCNLGTRIWLISALAPSPKELIPTHATFPSSRSYQVFHLCLLPLYISSPAAGSWQKIAQFHLVKMWYSLCFCECPHDFFALHWGPNNFWSYCNSILLLRLEPSETMRGENPTLHYINIYFPLCLDSTALTHQIWANWKMVSLVRSFYAEFHLQ